MLCCQRRRRPRQVSLEFDALDVNKSKELDVEELHRFVKANAQLWAMLGINTGLGEDRCIAIATQLAFEMAVEEAAAGASSKSRSLSLSILRRATSSSRSSKAQVSRRDASLEPTRTVSMSKVEFMLFKKNIVEDPKGQQRFFQRAVFAAYDADQNGTLDAKELTNFIDIFYQAGSIFKGDARLPTKEVLIRTIYKKLDSDGDGLLTFEELSSVISGSALRDLAEG